VVLMCVVFAVSILRNPVSAGILAIAIGALCLSVAILSYKAEVDTAEVRVRYLPFYTKRILVRDITYVLDERTLVLVTATAKIPLWGLSQKRRTQLFKILPRRLAAASPPPDSRIDSAVLVRRHTRWTILAGSGFVVAAAAVVPFLAGFPLHNDWNSAGKYVLVLCIGFFILFVFEAGFTYLLSYSKRALDRIERTQVHKNG
jgi:hypothetical protein